MTVMPLPAALGELEWAFLSALVEGFASDLANDKSGSVALPYAITTMNSITKKLHDWQAFSLAESTAPKMPEAREFFALMQVLPPVLPKDACDCDKCMEHRRHAITAIQKLVAVMTPALNDAGLTVVLTKPPAKPSDINVHVAPGMVQ